MATYRLEAKIIGRSQGRSATASAAYRAAEQIEDARTGQGFDYTRKRGVLHTEIIAPAGTPDWMQDRAQLWNAVERAEKRKDAQLAREILLSLPHELTPAQRIELVQGFVRQEFVAEGMIADIAVHAPDRQGDTRNHHAHVLLTMRQLAGDGFGPKVRGWNSTEQLEAWREHWAQAVNAELERHGHAARVDHRSLADQGLDREPEPKQGPVATEMEREGRPSHAGDDRRAAQARNAERAALADELETITAEVFDLEQERAKRAGQGGMSGNQTGDDAERQAQAELERRQRDQAAQQAEAQRQQETKDEARQRLEDMARENADIQVRQAEDMREQRARLDKFEAEQKRQAEEAQQEAERKREAEARGQQAEGEIRDAGDRYRVALGQHYDVLNPYGSLARAAMAEYGAFIRDREQLKAEIAKEQDPDARRALELRQEIEANDYMAITSQRIASQSEIITGRRDSEEAIRFRERAADYQEQSKELRQQYRDLAAERAMRDAAQQEHDDKQRREGAEEYQASKGNAPAQSLNRPEAKTIDHEPGGKGEISDAKAERIARIREQGRSFESDQKAREATPSQDRGGRSR